MAPERDPKHSEGPEAAKRFESNLKRILSVPKAELVKREAEYQRSRPSKSPRPFSKKK